ncbi:MAG: hypothetical protein ACK57O_18915, partial [Planctomyces sp.]
DEGEAGMHGGWKVAGEGVGGAAAACGVRSSGGEDDAAELGFCLLRMERARTRAAAAGELKFKVLEHFVIVDIDASYHSDVPGLSEVT